MPYWLRLVSCVALQFMMDGLPCEVLAADAPVHSPEAVEFFEKEIRPLLVAHCQACHGTMKSQGGLRLTSRESVLRGGDSGPALVPGKPDGSLLIKAVSYADDIKMPPRQKLPEADIAKLKRWIAMGVPWPATTDVLNHKAGFTITDEQRRWWSLQPLTEAGPPERSDNSKTRNEIDQFIFAKLDSQQMRPAPEAEPITLLRRVTYDLTGCPPSPADIESYLSDKTADPLANAVDQLLESKQYGVHWARHWLDVARYGDTRWVGAGEEKRWPFAYTYRDWVVRSLNNDVPYDRFVTLQLAADHVSDSQASDQAALGFLTVGRWFTGTIPDVIDDQIDVVTRGLMGLTVQCARCHDHKYDPISASDYYSLYGLFAASRMPVDGSGILATLPEVEPRPVDAATLQGITRLQRRVDEFLQERLTAVRDTYRPLETMRRYLQVSTMLVGKKDDDVRAYAAAYRLHPSILFRWFRLIQRTSQNSHAIFGPYHAFAGLPMAEFAAKAPAIVEAELARPKTNPHVLKILNPPPSSMEEVADRYLELLLKFNTAEKFNNYDEESLREVLNNSDSPLMVPLRELGEHLSADDLNQMIELRRNLLARQALLDERADQYVSYDREAATHVKDITGYIERRQTELGTELRSVRKIADGLLATHEAVNADENRLKSIIKARGMSESLLRRWIDYQKLLEQHHDPVFDFWRALTAIPDDDFATQSPQILTRLQDSSPNKIVAAAFVTPPATLAEAATRYGELIVSHQQFADTDVDASQIHSVWTDPQSPLCFSPEDVFDYFTRRDMDEVRNRERNLVRVYLEAPGAPPRAMVLRESGRSYDQRIFVRGNPNDFGDRSHGHFLTVLSNGPQAFQKGSGRLELAQQIVDPHNPLTARVLVNRVWQWHFGAGLVRTSSDFGIRGATPSHPELLDWLTRQFIADGWSLKKLHRRILLSATWRQSSRDVPEYRALDPENRLLWRMNHRRLSIEELRDSILAAAGRLDDSLGGRPIDLTSLNARRRTLYGTVDRISLPGFYRSFDFPSPDSHIAERFETIVPQQALFLMNNAFPMDQAIAIAGRTSTATSPSERIAMLYRLILGRSPDAEELDLSLQFIEKAIIEQPVEPHLPTRDSGNKASAPEPWRYGHGRYDEVHKRVVQFEPFAFFNGQWRASSQDNDPDIGRCSLNAQGGIAGRDSSVAAIRRWIAPRAGTLSVTGKLSVQPKSTEPSGDGVRARLVSSRHGLLGTWLVHGTEEQTEVGNITVQPGDTIDFVADGRGRDQSAGFYWVPILTMTAADAAKDEKLKWEADREFKGASAPPVPYDVWAQLAQVLIESNEFLILD